MDALEGLAAFLDGLAPVPDEPLRGGLVWPHVGCVRFGPGSCRQYFVDHLWQGPALVVGLLIGIDVLGWSIKRTFRLGRKA